MKERFEGDNRPNLIDALKRQEFVGGETALAEAMADEGELVEFAKGYKIITQGGEDNDIYLLVAGDVSIVIKGNEYTTRKAGQHVGEMAAIEPSQKRSADVVAARYGGRAEAKQPAVHEARAELPADLASNGARAFTTPLSEERTDFGSE